MESGPCDCPLRGDGVYEEHSRLPLGVGARHDITSPANEVAIAARLSGLAVAQLHASLSRQVASRAEHSPKDSIDRALHVCGDDADNLSGTLWMADYKVLSVKLYPDTAVVQVLITSVAHEHFVDAAKGYFEAKRRIADDTVSFPLVRTSAHPTWRVDCGGYLGGKLVGTRVVRDAQWEPPGFNADSAVALVDSIRRARDLPIVR